MATISIVEVYSGPTGVLRAQPRGKGRVENWRADSLGSGVYAFRCFRSVPSPAPVTTFPAPASSNTACGFPALCFPVVFVPRVMGPIDWGTLSTADKATAYSTSSSQMSAFALRYILRLRSCRLMDGFIIPSLPPLWSEKTSTAGRLRSAGITPPQRHYTPIRHPLIFDPFPGSAGYRAYLAPTVSRRDEEGFSSCSVCPCHRATATTPPKWAGRINQLSTVHAAFALRLRARPSECALSRPPVRSLALRPDDSLSPHGRHCR